MKIKICVTLILLITAIFAISLSKKEKKSEFVLKSYNNTVALYENGVKKEIYEQIVLNTLPEKDIYELKKGIKIANNEELSRILEDFDG